MGAIQYTVPRKENEETMNFFMRHCSVDAPALTLEAENTFISEIFEWEIYRDIQKHTIRRTYIFETTEEAKLFVTKVGQLAEREQHHPDTAQDKHTVSLEVYTHSVDGLTENDFIIAARADMIFEEMMGLI